MNHKNLYVQLRFQDELVEIYPTKLFLAKIKLYHSNYSFLILFVCFLKFSTCFSHPIL